MSRFALAFAFTLIAVSSHAQTDPRSSRSAPLAGPVPLRTGSFGESSRAVEHWAIGERAPDFELLTASGSRFLLHESRGRWVAMFFADRREELARLAELSSTLDSLQVRTLVVCHEKLHALAAWKGTPGASALTPLADERGDIASLYGLWDNLGGTTRQGLFLIDPNGVVRLALLGQSVSAPSLPGLVHSAAEGL